MRHVARTPARPMRLSDDDAMRLAQGALRRAQASLRAEINAGPAGRRRGLAWISKYAEWLTIACVLVVGVRGAIAQSFG